MRVLVRDLQPGQSYAIQFRAVTGTEASEWSQVMRLTTSNDVLAPAKVTGLTASVVETSFKVRWNQVTTNSDGSDLKDFKDYEIHVIDRDSGDDETYFVTETAFDFNFEKNAGAFGSAKPNLTFEVRARDVNYNAVAVPASVDISNDAPLAPTNFTVQPVVNAINFEWDGANNQDLKTYRVYKGSSAGVTLTKIYEGLSENFTYSSTNFGNDEYFRVAAVDVFDQETSVTNAISGAPLSYDSSDITPPAAPTWPGSWFVSETDLSNRTAIRANVTLTWNANSESDLGAYIVQYKKTADTVWSEVVISGTATVPPATSTKINGLAHNTAYDFRIAARDKTGNTSPFASAPGATTTTDNTPPTVPSTPAVSQSLGNLLVTWNGKNSTGGAMSSDTERVEVHVSTTSNFVPSASTLKTVFSSAYSGKTQSAVISGLSYGTTYYFRLVAVDFTGNTSAASTQASGSPARLTGLDIQNGSLSTDQINFTSRDIGGTRAFYQDTEPTDAESNEGDVWYNPAAGYVMKYYNGTDWVDARDAGIQDALNRITTAEGEIDDVRTTADGKNKIYTSPTKPTGGTYNEGDIWFREPDNRIHIYNGTDFVDALDSAVTAAATAADNADQKAVDAQAAADAAASAASAADTKATNAQSDADAAQTTANNAATAASDANDAALEAAGIAEAKGEIFYGTSAPTGYKDITKVLWIDQTGGANTPKRWNGSTWAALTDKVATDAAAAAAAADTAAGNAQSAADAAQSDADAAKTAADNAQSAADAAQGRADDAHTLATTAQETADGKNTVTYSTATPGATPNTAGDIWFQKNASQIIIGQWEGLGGTSWSKKTLDNAVIANLDAGKITAGFLSAGRIASRSITADKLVISDTSNLIGSGDFEEDVVGQVPAGWVSNNARVVDISGFTQGNGSGKALEIDARSGSNTDAYINDLISVQEGEKIYVEFEGRHLNTAGVGATRVGFREWNDKRVVLNNWISVATLSEYGAPKTMQFTKVSGIYTVPAGVGFVQPWASFGNNEETTNKFYVDNIRMHRMSAGELIVDGAITANKIATGSVDASKIAAGAVEADKIAAGAIEADKLAIGVRSKSFVDPMDNFDAWEYVQGSLADFTNVTVPDAQTGNTVLRIAPSVGRTGWISRRNPIPFDPNALYKITLKIRKTTAGTGTSEGLYFGLNGWADEDTRVNMNGDDSYSSQHYSTGNAQVPVGTEWLTYEGYFSGYAVTTGNGSTNPNSPGKMHPDVRFISPLVIVNYNGGSAVWEIDSVTLESVGSDSINGTTIANGAIVTAHMSANSIDGDRITAGTLDASKITAGSITADLIGTNQIITASANIANAVIDDAHITNVNASKITTGELAVGQRIIAGPAAGTHAEMSDTGFRVYAEDTIDGIPNEVVRLGTDTNDYFAVTKADGSLAATISDTGEASFEGLFVNSDPVIEGVPLSDTLTQFSRGPMAWVEYYANGWSTATNSEYGLADMTIENPSDEYRMVMIMTEPVEIAASGANEVALRLRYTRTPYGDPTVTPTVTSTLFREYAYTGFDNALSDSKHIVAWHRIPPQTSDRLLFTYAAANSFTTGVKIWTQPHRPFRMFAFDLGKDIPASGGFNNGGGTAAPTTRQYDTGSMAPASWATYQGDNSQRFDTNGEVVQGYYSSINGDGKGYIRWNIPNITGTVDRVDLYLYSSHWYYNSGGTAVINISDGTGANPAKEEANWLVGGFPKPGGKWMTLPSGWRDNFKNRTAKTITLGPAGTDLQYYGRFPWASARLRIWYTQ